MDSRIEITLRKLHQMAGATTDQLSIHHLAISVNLSPSRLRQLFKREIGESPKQHLRRVRMQRAEHLLQTTFLSVKEVTFFSGFRDVSHFVRDFKKQYGVTPTGFRTRIQPPSWTCRRAENIRD